MTLSDTETAWGQAAFEAIRDCLADLHGFQLDIHGFEQAEERPAGVGAIHISMRFLCRRASGREDGGTLLLPLPAAIALSGILLMLPAEAIETLRESEELDTQLRQGMLETGSMLSEAMNRVAKETKAFISVRFDGCQGVRDGVRPALPYEDGDPLLVGRATAELEGYPSFEILALLPPPEEA